MLPAKIDNAMIEMLGIMKSERLRKDPKTLNRWVNSKYWVKRALAAGSPTLTETQIGKLAEDPNPYILSRLAWNEKVGYPHINKITDWLTSTIIKTETNDEHKRLAKDTAYALTYRKNNKLNTDDQKLCRNLI